MKTNTAYIIKVTLIVALGGFLMGFDASVISGVIKFIEPHFDLSKIQLGWAVSCLTLTSTLAMMVSGPLSDNYGRKKILVFASILYAISAILSAIAPTFSFLIIARMIGGLGVGASLIIAPMYIAEISPPKIRGRMVSFNQLNIVLGISVAFFTNYLILKLSQSNASWAQTLKFDDYNWRWMLGLETLPAVLYFGSLFFVPESPRWLAMKGQFDNAFKIMNKASSKETAEIEFNNLKQNISESGHKNKIPFSELFKPSLKLVLIIGIVVAITQQITGINSVFFYAPMIFEQSGIGTDASFSQAILVGLTNLIFTLVAIWLIDKLGRKPLLIIGLTGIIISMLVLAGGFKAATYQINDIQSIEISDNALIEKLKPIEGKLFKNDVEFKNSLVDVLGENNAKANESVIIAKSINMNPLLILFGIIGFVASFAISIGPVMWVLFSELFPNYIRGLAISFIGFINSAISFSVQLVFPWELAVLGNSLTFLIYGIFGAVGLVFILIYLPETKGKSLEELEKQLIKQF
ncbi:MAG: sugar porter family MFS transporter [Bacteroidales bacterium]|nr:sugar porter family MFS transporter [Bacteroidales bacterium]